MPQQRKGLLTGKEKTEICQIGGIPPVQCERFSEAVTTAVRQFWREEERCCASAAQKEIRHLFKMVKSTLNCSQQKTQRPGKLKRGVADISSRLRDLSSEAKELLARLHLVIHHRLPDPTGPAGCPAPVIDPAAYPSLDEQLLALRDLYGVLSLEFVPKRNGPPRKHRERILYCEIALAYTLATGRCPSDTDTQFMKLAERIRQGYKLTQWSPGSIARLIRSDRANDNMALAGC